jgi:hypothetical protein
MKKVIFSNIVLFLFLAAVINAQSLPPTNLNYKHNPVTYVTCTAITPDTAVVTGAVDSFAVAPALPAGLSLDKATGIISGTPTTPTATATYTVTATNAAGSTTASLSITVSMSLLSPSNLRYSSNPVTYVVCTVIMPNTPTMYNGCTASYAVAPPLPAGLMLNTGTGVITGTPTTASATASYTVTATNAAGSTAVSLSITVNAVLPPPLNLTYSTNPATYMTGTAITPNTPTSSGGPVVSYSVSPALPAGLTLNTSTGVITGTPTAAMAAANYTVTANRGNEPCIPKEIALINITIIDPTNISVTPAIISPEVRAFNAHYSNNVLTYGLPGQCFVRVKYYDVKGRTIASFVNTTQSAGYYSLPLNFSSWSRGIYIQVFKAGSFEKRETIIAAK